MKVLARRASGGRVSRIKKETKKKEKKTKEIASRYNDDEFLVSDKSRGGTNDEV